MESVKCRKAGFPQELEVQTGLLRGKNLEPPLPFQCIRQLFHMPSDFSLLHHFSPAAHFAFLLLLHLKHFPHSI